MVQTESKQLCNARNKTRIKNDKTTLGFRFREKFTWKSVEYWRSLTDLTTNRNRQDLFIIIITYLCNTFLEQTERNNPETRKLGYCTMSITW